MDELSMTMDPFFDHGSSVMMKKSKWEGIGNSTVVSNVRKDLG